MHYIKKPSKLNYWKNVKIFHNQFVLNVRNQQQKSTSYLASYFLQMQIKTYKNINNQSFIYAFNFSIVIKILRMSLLLHQQICPSKEQIKEGQELKGRQLSTFSFIFLSTLMVLTSMMVMVRLHQFDQLTEAATIKYASLKQDQSMQQYIKEINQSSLNIFTDFRFESAYLLPIVTMVSIFFFLNFKLTFEKLYDCIKISVIGTLVCFLATLLAPQSFLLYRITYILHTAFLTGLLLTSSFCFYKLMPSNLKRYKEIYCLLMFMIPFFGEPFQPYITNLGLSYNLHLTQHSFRLYILRIATIGSTVSTLLIFFLIEMKDQINKIIYEQSQEAFISEKQVPLDKFGAYVLKKKKRDSFETMFGVNIEKLIKNVKQRIFLLTVLGWTLIIAVGNQIPRLQQGVLNLMQPRIIPIMENLQLNLSRDPGQMNQQLSTAFIHMNISQQVLGQAFVIFGSIVLLMLNKRIGSVSLMTICYLINFSFILILMAVLKGYIGFSFPVIRALMLLHSCFIQSMIIPAIYTTNLPLRLSQKAIIVLFLSKLIEVSIRMLTQYITIDKEIIILGLISALPLLYFGEKLHSKNKTDKKYTPSYQSEYIDNQLLNETCILSYEIEPEVKLIQNQNLLDQQQVMTLQKSLQILGMNPQKIPQDLKIIPQDLTINMENLANIFPQSLSTVRSQNQIDKQNDSLKQQTSSESQNRAN